MSRKTVRNGRRGIARRASRPGQTKGHFGDATVSKTIALMISKILARRSVATEMPAFKSISQAQSARHNRVGKTRGHESRPFANDQASLERWFALKEPTPTLSQNFVVQTKPLTLKAPAFDIRAPVSKPSTAPDNNFKLSKKTRSRRPVSPVLGFTVRQQAQDDAGDLEPKKNDGRLGQRRIGAKEARPWRETTSNSVSDRINEIESEALQSRSRAAREIIQVTGMKVGVSANNVRTAALSALGVNTTGSGFERSFAPGFSRTSTPSTTTPSALSLKESLHEIKPSGDTPRWARTPQGSFAVESENSSAAYPLHDMKSDPAHLGHVEPRFRQGYGNTSAKVGMRRINPPLKHPKLWARTDATDVRALNRDGASDTGVQVSRKMPTGARARSEMPFKSMGHEYDLSYGLVTRAQFKGASLGRAAQAPTVLDNLWQDARRARAGNLSISGFSGGDNNLIRDAEASAQRGVADGSNAHVSRQAQTIINGVTISITTTDKQAAGATHDVVEKLFSQPRMLAGQANVGLM